MMHHTIQNQENAGQGAHLVKIAPIYSYIHN